MMMMMMMMMKTKNKNIRYVQNTNTVQKYSKKYAMMNSRHYVLVRTEAQSLGQARFSRQN
jgi:hypothetical protein